MRAPQPLLKHDSRWLDTNGRPTREFFKYMRNVDEVVRTMAQKIEDLEIRVHDLENP